MKYSKAKTRSDGTKPVDIAISIFGYRSHISIDRQNGIIRRQVVAGAAQHDGARLRKGPIQKANTGRKVWVDSAYLSAANEDWLDAQGLKSEIHCKKPWGRPLSRHRNAMLCRPRDVEVHLKDERSEIRDTREGRTRIRSPEGSPVHGHQHHRPRSA